MRSYQHIKVCACPNNNRFFHLCFRSKRTTMYAFNISLSSSRSHAQGRIQNRRGRSRPQNVPKQGSDLRNFVLQLNSKDAIPIRPSDLKGIEYLSPHSKINRDHVLIFDLIKSYRCDNTK